MKLLLCVCILALPVFNNPLEAGGQQIVAGTNNPTLSNIEVKNDTRKKRQLVPLNDAVIVPLVIPPHPIHDYDAPNLSEFSTHTTFTDELMNLSKAFVNETFLQFVTEGTWANLT